VTFFRKKISQKVKKSEVEIFVEYGGRFRPINKFAFNRSCVEDRSGEGTLLAYS